MLRAYPLPTHEMLFDAHNHALAALGGVTERGIYDNMKTAVDKVRRGKRRDVNKRFKAMVSHCLFEAAFCNPAAGWEKGQVEKNVRDSRYRIWHNAPSFKTLTDLNSWPELRCKDLWQEISHPEDPGRKVADVWAEECNVLMAVPAPFTELPDAFKRLQRILLKRLGGDREMANILALVLHHDEHLVMQAVEAALQSGQPSQQHVTNVLGRLLEGPLPAPLEPPPALALVNEPVANTQRYDNLRENYRVR